MKLKALLTAVAIAATLMMAGTAQAHELSSKQVHVFEQRLSKSESVVNWWEHRGHWALHLRHRTCADVAGKQRRHVCVLARKSLAAHKARAERLNKLLHPEPVYAWGDIQLAYPWSCIHAQEGGWTAINPAGPYYGGFQMDVSFQKEFGKWAYLKWGTADHWPPSVQYQVAQRAPLSRWPTMAKC